jgi:DNA-binding MarR family transcriptional regulator
MTNLAPPSASLPASGDRLTALADRLLGALSAVRRNGRHHAARPVELAPLTGAQLELVRLVRRHPGTSVADAAAQLRLAANTVSTLVGQLVDEGLLERGIDAADRRVARLQLRPEIRRKVDAWRDRRMLNMAAAISRLSTADRQALARAVPVLERLAGELEEEPS